MSNEQILFDEQTLFSGVCDCIRQTLEKDLPEIHATDRLIADLGIDSLDFLDLIFRLEQQFNVSVNPRDMERRTQEILGDEPMQVDGCYTARAVEEFRKAMPEVPAEELFPNMPANRLPACFRVKTFMNLVAFAQAGEGGEK
ncbi:MAG: phosphopantetheine-binding protein [Zoogloeaceae bacterium]|jgi:acyl carrier protein|nr:phosphopantetheine-binding protein [Zoogloeaceae bacterium]